MSDNRTTELLSVGDILWNEPCDERMVVVAADSVCVWVRKVEKSDKLMMVGGDVWANLSRKRGIKNRCSQHYAQTVFDLDGHVEQAIAATLGNQRHVETCENMREKFGYKRLFVCSECGVTFDPDCEINYCPCCGRKVVDNAD